MVLKAYKYRLYPNKDQEHFLNQNFGAVRFIWNQLVANFNSWSKDGPNRPMNEKILKNNEEFKWLNSVISYALQQKRMDFEETKKQFFNKKRAIKLGKMKFKKKGIARNSFRIPGQALKFNDCINFETSQIKLPKMKPMKLVIDRKFNGRLKSVTISKNSCNQYFASVLIEEESELKQNTDCSIGIDLGLIHFATLSDGTKIENPKWFRESQSKLKQAQQHLSRKIKDSKRYEKQRLKVAKIHLKIANQRKWFHHVLSSWLIDNFDTICMEKLNVKGMVKNHKLAKSISDAGWSSFVSMINYKSNWYGKTFYQIDTFYPSSKTCSCCGHVLDSLPLDIREWDCPSCGSKHHRDLNAAINILDKGLIDLYDFTSTELTDYRHREELSPLVKPTASSMKCLASFIAFDRNA